MQNLESINIERHLGIRG